jgi:hypothetical protein
MPFDRRAALAALFATGLPGCTSLGPSRLDRDQLDYTRAVADSSKRQTLFNLVRMRFGDSPAFLSVNQLVSSYSLRRSGNVGTNIFPSGAINTFFGLGGDVELTDSPTFTLQPVAGERFVESYLRPLPPNEVIPLIQGGVPADLLLWLIAQSIGPLQNTHPLARGHRGGSAGFRQTLIDLRRLQEGGAMNVAVRGPKGDRHAYLQFNTTARPDLAQVQRELYTRLGLTAAAREVKVVYGTSNPQRTQAPEIPILTRALIGVMSAIAAEIEVPEAAVRSGRTKPTLREPGDPPPMLQVFAGPTLPENPYAAVRFAESWYWIDDNDYRSKLIFSIFELLKSIAESAQAQNATVLTIPAR